MHKMFYSARILADVMSHNALSRALKAMEITKNSFKLQHFVLIYIFNC